MERVNIEQALGLFKRDEEDYSIDGKCSRCTECCGAILPLTKKEIDKITNYIKKYNIKPVPVGIPFVNFSNLTCPFADKTNRKCLIYNVRPVICRKYHCYKEKNLKDLVKSYDEMPQLYNMNQLFRTNE